MPSDKMIYVTELNESLKKALKINHRIKVYRSKGLITHLLKRKHYTAVKYFDYIPDIIEDPDFAGFSNGQIELIKYFKENILLSIKLDQTRNIYYVATLFDVKQSKIDSYCKSGRIIKLDKNNISL